MFGRLLGELGKFGREHRPDDLRGSRYQLVAAVVNLTGTKESTPASASFAFPVEGLGLRLAVKEVYLAAESAEATLDAVERGETAMNIGCGKISGSAGVSPASSLATLERAL